MTRGTPGRASRRRIRPALRKRWAEYFAAVTTSGLIPLEIFELARHFTVTRVVIALINVLIVWCPVARLRSH